MFVLGIKVKPITITMPSSSRAPPSAEQKEFQLCRRHLRSSSNKGRKLSNKPARVKGEQLGKEDCKFSQIWIAHCCATVLRGQAKKAADKVAKMKKRAADKALKKKTSSRKKTKAPSEKRKKKAPSSASSSASSAPSIEVSSSEASSSNSDSPAPSLASTTPYDDATEI